MRRLDNSGQIYSSPHNFLSYVLTFTFIILLLIGTLAQLIWLNDHGLRSVSGTSMRPLLNNYENTEYGDMVLISKRNNVEHQDIVVFTDKLNSSETENKQLIKRVIGLSGDKINMILNSDKQCIDVYLNDTLLDEPYVLQAENQAQFSSLTQKYLSFKNQAGWDYWKTDDHKIVSTYDGGIIVPDGCMFCLGDNRIDSFDSRSFGPVPIEWCEGIVEGILLKGSFYTQVLSVLYGFWE